MTTRAAFQGFQGGGGQPSPEQFQQARQKMTEIRTATDAKILGVLTDAQKKQFETMKGAAFKFPERTFGRGGGRGNGGGNGNGRGNGARPTTGA